MKEQQFIRSRSAYVGFAAVSFVSFVVLSSAAFADSDADRGLALATQWCSKTIQGWTMVKRVRLSPP